MEKGELNKLLRELTAKIKGAGIPVSDSIIPEVRINSRAKKRLGCCIFRNNVYEIEVSERLLDNKALTEETLAHELLHTCPGCRNHGKQWKAYAAIVNKSFGYSVQRAVRPEDAGISGGSEPQYRYVLRCERCNAEIERVRMSKVIKRPRLYRCKCGGKLIRIQ